jgi:hypothetical protein
MFFPSQYRAFSCGAHGEYSGYVIFYLELGQPTKGFIVDGFSFEWCNNCSEASFKHNRLLLLCNKVLLLLTTRRVGTMTAVKKSKKKESLCQVKSIWLVLSLFRYQEH